MEDIACGDMTGVNWRSMPLSYRDLWEELDTTNKVTEDRGKRAVWGTIKELVEKKTKRLEVSIEAVKTNGIAQIENKGSIREEATFSEKL
jgi:hypothetical protein